MQNLNHADCDNKPPSKMEVSNNTDYQRLDQHSTQFDEESPPVSTNSRRKNHNINLFVNRRWLNSRLVWLLILLGVVIAVSAVVAIKHFGPYIMKKEVIPLIHWLIESCSQPVLVAILFAGIALFPLLLLPTVQFKWIAGMTFGYGFSLLLIMPGIAVAVTLPYFIAYHLFLHMIERWLDNHPEKAAIVRLAGDGDWLHQFKAVALIRVSPFPYVAFNYVAVVTGVKYSPYLVGTMIGMLPEILFAIYSGRLLRRVAESMEEHTDVSKSQMIVDVIGFCLAAVATIAIGFYSKRKLEQLQEVEEEQQLQ